MFGGHYTYTDAEERSGDNKGKQLVYRPENTALAYIGYQDLDYDIRLEAEYVGKIYTSASNDTFMDDYTLFSISGNYYLSPNPTVNSRIENLTNQDYTTNESFEPGYNQDGITSYLSNL